ncbi:MAG: general secretion pathway protein GspK [Limnohabitans sp.]|jgi:general secretion pathway protein K|nr:general secretion pathway protein GspK [Limnohabitans sp.]
MRFPERPPLHDTGTSAGTHSPRLPRQGARGMALITAMLTVALIATLAATALWQQWRSLQVETAERQRQQSVWLLTGALDWARLILREDGRSGNTDHLGEPWALPLQEARLSSFLASSSDGVSEDDAAMADRVFLSGQILDLQARLNVFNLMQGDQASAPDLAAFGRLFELLGLPRAALDSLVQQLLAAQRTDSRLLLPQRFSQLNWMGLSPLQLARLEPFITWLPVRTNVNLNTAPPEVLYASVPQLPLAQAQRAVQLRDSQHWRTLEEATRALGDAGAGLAANLHGVSTNYVEVIGRVRLGSTTLTERSVIQRDENQRVLWRERGTLATPSRPTGDGASRMPTASGTP